MTGSYMVYTELAKSMNFTSTQCQILIELSPKALACLYSD